MDTLKNNLANLVKVKTLVTLLLTIVFCVLALTGVISGEDFLHIFTVIIAFYFGIQAEKKAEGQSSADAKEQTVTLQLGQAQVNKEAVDAAVMNKVHPPEQEN